MVFAPLHTKSRYWRSTGTRIVSDRPVAAPASCEAYISRLRGGRPGRQTEYWRMITHLTLRAGVAGVLYSRPASTSSRLSSHVYGGV